MNDFPKMLICLLLLLLPGVWTGCRQAPATQEASEDGKTETTEIVIEAEDFLASQGEVSVQTLPTGEQYVQSPPGDSWLAFEVEVPVAGRYRMELLAGAEAAGPYAWVEDYYDNQDGRTYNITGNMQLPLSGPEAAFGSVAKDGSPLNAGTHKVKLHLQAGPAKVDRIRLSLLRQHQLTPNHMTQNTSGKSWKVVWADEFEQDGMLDEEKWTYDIGNWGWGNNELQYYTERRKENARIENGNLIIEARKNDLGHAWTSARITTRGKVSFTYGKIEIRAKVPTGRGSWAAGWTLGDSYVDELSWPYCGEIDILESVGYETDDESGNGKAHASVHCGAYYFKLGNQPTSTLEVANMNQQYHTYALEWLPDGIRAFVDGQKYFEYTDTSTPLAWPFDKPQNLILNLAMGGGWGGAQGMDESLTSQQYIIDYVRVYELE